MKRNLKTLLLGLSMFMAVSWLLQGARTLPNFGRLMLPAAAETQPPVAASATVTTDQHHYFQGETMVIKGANFKPSSPIVLTVKQPDGVVVTIPAVTSDTTGAFTAYYVAPGINGSYRITASDGVNSADTSAADPFIGTIAIYSQCSNDRGLGYSTGDTGCRWINGNLNGNNSRLIEGDATVQRALLTGMTNGSHTITFQYNTTKGGTHAYDFLVDDKLSEYYITDADMCDDAAANDFPSCASTPAAPDGPNSVIPPDPLAGGREETFYPGQHHFRIRNGSISSVGNPTVVSGSYAGDSETSIQVTFNVNTATCKDVKQVHGVDTCPVLITFGAHISKKTEWDGQLTASKISGSPYHVALVNADGSSIGQRDNQMQASSIDAGLTLKKTVTDPSVNGGTAPASAWTLSATGPEGFSGPGNSPLVTNVAVEPGTYNLSESGGPASGYTNGTVWNCRINLDAPFTGTSITLAATDTGVCTIENTRDTGTLELRKVWEGGAASTTIAIGTSAGGSEIAGKLVTGNDTTGQKTVATGTYYLSETPIDKYDSTLACTDNGVGTPVTGNSVVVAKGHAVVCTFNNRKRGTLTLVKNTSGGNGTFNFTANVPGVPGSINLQTTNFTASQTWDGVVTPGGPYSIAENPTSEWIVTSSSCSNGTPASFTVPAGGSVTCTFNNTLAGYLLVQKTTYPSGDTTVFAINASGSGTIEGGGAANVTDALDHQYKVMPGTYSVTETVPAGWDQTANTCSNITIASGETKTCVIENTKRGHLVVQKTTEPANDTTVFAINASGSGVITGGGAGTVTDALDKDYEVTPGTYSITETVPNGWDKTGDTCQNVIVDAGKTVTCQLTNVKHGHLIVKKVTDPANDSTLFDITASGSGNIFGSASAQISTSAPKDYEVMPGTFSVTETVPAGWDMTGNTCQNVVVAAGATVECTITNVKRGHVIVQKTTLPAGDTQEFTVTISPASTNTTGSSGIVTDATDFDFEVRPGSYSVAETVPAGWDKTADNCQNLVVAAGQKVYCTIENTKRGHIIVQKTTLPAGETQPFTVTVSPSSTNATGNSGIVTDANDFDFEVRPGTYSVAETVPQGWDKTADGCQNLAVAPGQKVYCTIENTKRGHIIVEKTTLPAGSPQQFTVAVSPASTVTSSNPSFVTDAIDHDFEVKPGTYSVTETVPAYWEKTGDTCQGIVVGPGEIKHCQLTNTELGKITIVKNTVGGNSTFTFNATGLSLSTVALQGGGSREFENLRAGDYTITETVLPGWELTGLACNTSASAGPGTTASVSGATSSIHLAPGGEVTCTYVNSKMPTITIVKQIKGDPGSFTFNIAGTTPYQASIAVNTSNGSASDGPHAVEPGDYTVTEQVQPRWTLTDLTCTAGAAGPDVAAPIGVADYWGFTLTWGQDVTCTFLNNGIGTTRTQGFWQSHTALANTVWNGTSGLPLATAPGADDTVLCGTKPITAIALEGQNQLMGGFWAQVSQKSTGSSKDAKRTDIDHARMQMLQQYLAAVLNVYAFGYGSSKDAMLTAARTAYCGNNAKDIQAQVGILDAFNTSGDSNKFTPGASATPQTSKSQADIPYWDVTK